ncbi:long-chain-fatty-acid--CoA ligase heimdall-like [Musca autumnalis]|uniref:long-chain-fatty-acid--CoA ligase heimdall-like n=1 Tax=Musca autumnalis TaxID=221902 RepID=UPI003CF39B16
MAPLKPAENIISCSLQEPVKICASAENLNEFKPKTIPELFRECCEKYSKFIALAYKEGQHFPINNNWIKVNYEEYYKRVEKAAIALLYLGVEPRSAVAILAGNCPEWFCLELAAMRINAVVAGIYTTNSAEAVYHNLNISDATIVVVDDSQQMAKIRAIRTRLPKLKAVIQLHGPYDFREDENAKNGCYSWKDLMAMEFDESLRMQLRCRERDVAPNVCALLVFTSGTVGLPKAVMLSHDAMLYAVQALNKSLTFLKPGKESCISYLPLSHIVAQTFDIFLGMLNGAAVYFADRNAVKGSLADTLIEVQPTWFFGVPRIFEKIIENQRKTEAKLYDNEMKNALENARRAMLKYHMDQMAGNSETSEAPHWPSQLIKDIKISLGLNRVKVLFAGGAPVSEEIKRYFLSLDLPVVEAYGMSETSGGISFDFERPNLQTCGKAVTGLELQIYNPDVFGEGEILIRSRGNLMGYLKEPIKTLEALTEDGYVRGGDRGHLDADGNLYISGRIKEIIITSGGENISPVYIEDIIKKELPCISNAMVVGDNRKYLTVLLTFKTLIDPDTGYPTDILSSETLQWLAALDIDHYKTLKELLNIQPTESLHKFDPIQPTESLHKFDPNKMEVVLDSRLFRALDDGIQRYNQQAISNAQKIQYFSVLSHDFSIPTGELGPTLKSRRSFIHKKYATIIDKMYHNK